MDLARLYRDIQDWQHSGRSIEDTYLHFQHLISQEQLQAVWTGDAVPPAEEPEELDFFRLTRSF